MPAVFGNYILIISGDKLDALQVHSLSQTSGREAAVPLLNFTQYYFEELYCSMDEIVDPGCPHCTIRKNLKHLAELVLVRVYHDGLSMIPVLLSAVLNSDTSSVVTLFDDTTRQKVVKSGFVLILPDGHYCQNVVQMLPEEGRYSWTQRHFRATFVNMIIYENNSAIWQPEAISLCNVLTHWELPCE